MKTITLALTLTLLGVALAGCALPGQTPTATTTVATTTTTVTTTPDVTTTTAPPATTTTPPVPTGLTNESFTVATSGVPQYAKPGAKFNFTLYVNGTETADTDHLGAHFGSNTSTAPSTTVYDKACEHGPGRLPGTFVVNCTIATEGTHYLRGHARVTTATGQLNYWGPELTIQAINYNITATGIPATAVSNQTFTFTLGVTGNTTLASDHIGAHFGNVSTTTPSTAVYNGTCAHVIGSVPGTFDITCRIINKDVTPQKFYVRGHVRLTDANGVQTNYWSGQEHEITVSPGGIL